MAKQTLTVHMRLDGARETLRAFRGLPKDANNELRDASQRLAKALAVKAKADATTNGGPQGRLLAPTVRAARDRVPVVQVGGTRRVGRFRQPAYGVLFGSVFGMNGASGWYNRTRYRASHGRQYRPHRGTQAYWFFPLVEHEAGTISREWNRAADEIVQRFATGGGA
ncbi:hypothetical protein [Amycolatopsis sp. CA-230715]|uniref:hypothetical protein n=1 Tax=Amycolatopsis sp. CA-230715 TaxID=2745196 RepID=UPI001C032B5E|nr:hypothetical protein [Amycolatopsis sp. CA-230715]QWF81133.1 hypothetical protein HUW46_04559 [Amycolatopsis sp. CA-230715]